MALACTLNRDGKPTSRIVGIKGFDKAGFKIATNGNSAKAKQLDENPFGSLMFFWEPLNRMVRIDGAVSKLPGEDTAAIWRGLAHNAQLLHSASRQSDVINSKQEVVTRLKALAETYPDNVQVPPNPAWFVTVTGTIDKCSYNLEPSRWEFYETPTVCPDRVVFRRPADSLERADGVNVHLGLDGWFVERLSP